MRVGWGGSAKITHFNSKNIKHYVNVHVHVRKSLQKNWMGRGGYLS